MEGLATKKRLFSLASQVATQRDWNLWGAPLRKTLLHAVVAGENSETQISVLLASSFRLSIDVCQSEAGATHNTPPLTGYVLDQRGYE